MSYKITINYGHCELKQIGMYENGKYCTYGYRIDYDRDGKEISRTEPTFLSSIGYDDRDFTPVDLAKLEC